MRMYMMLFLCAATQHNYDCFSLLELVGRSSQFSEPTLSKGSKTESVFLFGFVLKLFNDCWHPISLCSARGDRVHAGELGKKKKKE